MRQQRAGRSASGGDEAGGDVWNRAVVDFRGSFLESHIAIYWVHCWKSTRVSSLLGHHYLLRAGGLLRSFKAAVSQPLTEFAINRLE